jgi:hypothetical protein
VIVNQMIKWVNKYGKAINQSIKQLTKHVPQQKSIRINV